MKQNDPSFTDVFVAGDWTQTAFPCGSIEAAVSSGLWAGRYIANKRTP
jgi:uncharacterized protein with NAD-binding domain and iron-sulfur cluster